MKKGDFIFNNGRITLYLGNDYFLTQSIELNDSVAKNDAFFKTICRIERFTSDIIEKI